MLGHLRRRRTGSMRPTGEIVHNPHLHCRWRRDGPISLSLLLHYGKAWRLSSLRDLDPSRSPQTRHYRCDCVLAGLEPE